VQSPGRHLPVSFHKENGGYLCIYESGLCWREEILKTVNTEKYIKDEELLKSTEAVIRAMKNSVTPLVKI
jgi:hypothetical protein